ncbi:hypothetical protein SAMN05660659_05552, partial [Pseudomonas sp. LAMO17WK12:I6]
GEAVLLTRPKVQQAEADGTTLQPIKAVEALTVNIDSQDLLPSDLLSVTWTGAPGTAAGGSHTTPARPISETTLTIELPVTVLAFNLGKTVTVTYTVTRNGVPRTSLPLLLNVGTLPDSSLKSPVIMEADNDGEGPEFNVANLTANAVARIDVWPLIATGQRMWMRLTGTNANDTPYINDIAPGDPVTQPLIDRGYQNRGLTQAAMKNLKDGSDLTIECKTTFNKSTNESEAVPFPVRTYTIKAFEDVRPEIIRVEDSKGNEILPGATTVDTSIKLEGKGAKGQKVLIKDGNIEIGIADVDPQSGDWEFPVTGLALVSHSFTATAQYGNGQVSDPWVVVVTAPTAPTITRVENSKGEEILPGATIVDTSIKLEGKGAKGQKVLIKDGNIEIGTADIDPQSGDWEFPVTGLSADTHSFTATAMYGSGQVSDPPRIVVVVAADTPAITSVKDESNWNIRENGYTVHTSITLTGSAPTGQEVEVFLGAVSKGKAKAESNSIWTRTVSGLSLDVLHTFKVIGQYANNPPSNTWRLTVLNGVRPAITGAEDSKGQPISNDGSTGDTTVRLRGTATKYLEVEIFDGNSSTGKRVEANGNGIWTVELTGLTRTKHVFKAKALYGSGTDSGEWIVNVVDLVDLVENFSSYPPSVRLRIPGESMQGDNTKVTLNEIYGGQEPINHVVAMESRKLIGSLATRTTQNILVYSLALKQGSAKSTILRGWFNGFYQAPVSCRLEFLKNNVVVDSTEILRGNYDSHVIYAEYAPINGQAFDTLKFETKALSYQNTQVKVEISEVTFKS